MTMLQPEELDALSQVEELLSKFAMYTNVAGGEQYTTLSLVKCFLKKYYSLRDQDRCSKRI